VYLQTQAREESAQSRHHPLAGAHASHVHVHIVGVANEAAAAGLERFVVDGE
jgi:hypothetical protein